MKIDFSQVVVKEKLQEKLLEDSRKGMKLSFAQLLIGLVQEGWLSEPEGSSWLAGTLPEPVLKVIKLLPKKHQFAATVRATRPSEVLRADPIVRLIGASQGKTEEELDKFFLHYSEV
jgi:hypothetical protein